MNQSQSIQIPRQLANQAADWLWQLDLFADAAETIALTIRALLNNQASLPAYQIDLLLRLHEDLQAFGDCTPKDCCCALNELIERS